MASRTWPFHDHIVHTVTRAKEDSATCTTYLCIAPCNNFNISIATLVDSLIWTCVFEPLWHGLHPDLGWSDSGASSIPKSTIDIQDSFFHYCTKVTENTRCQINVIKEGPYLLTSCCTFQNNWQCHNTAITPPMCFSLSMHCVYTHHYDYGM